MTPRRYFTRQDAYLLLGRRVQARVAIIRSGQAKTLIVPARSCGTVVKLAFGPSPDSYLLGVQWDAPPSSVPRRASYPIDWYTADEYRELLETAVEKAA